MRTSTFGDDAWNPNRYLNLWVCEINTDTQVIGTGTYIIITGGYVIQGPSVPGSPIDGVVIDYKNFGLKGTYGVDDLGRTGTHEVGHWLNLQHLWGSASIVNTCLSDNVCGASDGVCDTPPQPWSTNTDDTSPNFPHISSCGTASNAPDGNMFMNYMDYVYDNYYNMFTNGQKARSYALFAPGGARAQLVAPFNPASTPTAVLLTASPSLVCAGSSNVTLTAGLVPADPAATYSLWEVRPGGATVPLGIPATSSPPTWTLPIPSTTTPSTATYEVLAVSSGGCVLTAQTTVGFDPSNVSLTTTPACLGDPTSLYVSRQGPGTTISWGTVPAGGTTPTRSLTNQDAWNVTLTSSTTYQVTITYPSGCSATAQVLAVVLPVPVATLNVTTPLPICAGTTSLVTLEGPTPDPAVIYTLRNAGGTTIQPNPGMITQWSFPPVPGATTYTLTAALASCNASASVAVTVHPTPVVELNPTTSSICPGQGATLTATSSVPGTTYELYKHPRSSNPSPIQPTSTSSWTVYPTATTMYLLQATTSDGCTSGAFAQVEVIELPTVQITPANTTVTPNSAPFDLTATVVLNGVVVPGAAAHGEWKDARGNQVGVGATYQVDPTVLSPGIYPFTYYYQGPCGAQVAVAYVTVMDAVCPIEKEPYIIVLKDTVYDASSAGQINLFNEPGAVYHIMHDVRLINGTFYLQSGCKIYFDGDTKLTIGPGAYLGGYWEPILTAACGEMWDGILVADGSGGLNLEGATISHSQRGIVLQFPDLDLQLRNCLFENNLESVSVVPTGNSLLRPVDVTWQNVIENCTFTAHDFLPPWAGQTRLSRTHLNIGNWDVRAWTIANNTFERMLMGIYGGSRVGEPFSKRSIGATLHNNTFSSFVLAGVVSPVHTWMGAATTNHFLMRTSAAPGNAFMEEVMVSYQLTSSRTTGMLLNAADATCQIYDLNEFSYTTRPTSYLGFGSLTSPTFQAPLGVYVGRGRPRIENNTFRYLEAGVTLGVWSGAQIIDNEFNDCRLGASLRNTGAPNPEAVRLTCNTFNRTTSNGHVAFPGQSAGIFVEPGANVLLANTDATGVLVPTGPGQTPSDGVKNLFYPRVQGAQGNEYWHVYNSAGNAALQYKTFSNAGFTPPLTSTSNMLTAGNVSLTLVGFNYDPTAYSCSVEDNLPSNGLQRPAVAGGLGGALVPVPNPADASVTFTLTLPGGAGSAEILLRESISGYVVARYPVTATATALNVPTQSLPSGLYLATLVVNSRPAASVRLQITH